MAFVKERHPEDAVIFGVSMPVSLYVLGMIFVFIGFSGTNASVLKIPMLVFGFFILSFNFWYFKVYTNHDKIMKEFEAVDILVKRRSSIIAFLFTALSFPFPWLCLWVVTR